MIFLPKDYSAVETHFLELIPKVLQNSSTLVKSNSTQNFLLSNVKFTHEIPEIALIWRAIFKHNVRYEKASLLAAGTCSYPELVGCTGCVEFTCRLTTTP